MASPSGIWTGELSAVDKQVGTNQGETWSARMGCIAAQLARPWIRWGFPAVLSLLVLAGFLGLDRAFYEHVSLRLYTENPLDRDFYAHTQPLWLVLRILMAHVVGAGIAYVFVGLQHREHWRAANRLLLTVGAAVIVAFVLESVIGRLRPDQADSALTFTPLRAFTRFHNREVCFPSGEATMAFAMAYGLSRLVPRFAGLFYTLATLASIARLVNGSHYLGDVAAGALLGLLCGRVVYGYLSTSGPPSLRASQCP
jgi:membrane-associated phospholipid phosphatase